MRNKGLILAACLLCLGGCEDRRISERNDSDSSDSPTAPTNRIDVSATTRANLGITFAKVERRQVADTLRIPGAFELQPRARHEYRMTLPGRVEFLVNQFDKVQVGTALYRFQSPQWPELQHEIIIGEQDIDSALAKIAVADAKLKETQTTLQLQRSRVAALAAADFKRADLNTRVSELEASIPRLEAELGLAQTLLVNARRTLAHALHRASSATGIPEDTLTSIVEHEHQRVPSYRAIDWIEVRATEAGVVESLAATHGAFVEPPSVVISTVDPNRLRFRAMGLQSDFPRLSASARTRISPPRSTSVSINDSVDAQLTIGLEAHPDHRTIALFAAPQAHRPWMRPGVSAFLEIELESTEGLALVIPRSAVVKDGIQHIFFRRDPHDANKVIRSEADLGAHDGRWVAIQSGLAPTDEVVLDGAYELMLALQTRGVSPKGGHFHADGSYHGDH